MPRLRAGHPIVCVGGRVCGAGCRGRPALVPSAPCLLLEVGGHWPGQPPAGSKQKKPQNPRASQVLSASQQRPGDLSLVGTSAWWGPGAVVSPPECLPWGPGPGRGATPWLASQLPTRRAIPQAHWGVKAGSGWVREGVLDICGPAHPQLPSPGPWVLLGRSWPLPGDLWPWKCSQAARGPPPAPERGS